MKNGVGPIKDWAEVTIKDYKQLPTIKEFDDIVSRFPYPDFRVAIPRALWEEFQQLIIKAANYYKTR